MSSPAYIDSDAFADLALDRRLVFQSLGGSALGATRPEHWELTHGPFNNKASNTFFKSF
jgi:hypothetical protein